MIFRIASVTFSVVALFAPNLNAQQKVPSGAKVLMLSGGQRSHHAYRRQAYLLQKVLEDSKKFEVTICEDADILTTPGLQKYDVVAAMADRRDPEFRLTQKQQEALLAFVGEGKGLYAFHGFCCADKQWVPQMRELLGGVLAHFGTPDTKVRVGRYPIKIVDPAHPIAQGVSDFEHDDELYYYLQTHGELHPVAVAVYEGKEWPILWARPYGKGRCCVSVFGHCGIKPDLKDPLEHAPFQKLVVQGIAWAAARNGEKP